MKLALIKQMKKQQLKKTAVTVEGRTKQRLLSVGTYDYGFIGVKSSEDVQVSHSKVKIKKRSVTLGNAEICNSCSLPPFGLV